MTIGVKNIRVFLAGIFQPVFSKELLRSNDKYLECPVCGSTSLEASARKFDVQYLFCVVCAIIFTQDLDPEIIQTHNSKPEDRADLAVQTVRVQRMRQHLGYVPEKILDFGCGRGEFVEFARAQGFQAYGVDQDTKLTLSDFAEKSLDVINMVEVIEHLGAPYKLLEKLTSLLKPGGILYIESSFVDTLGDPAKSEYVDPRIGHCCIHSRRSINYLSVKLKMRQIWINENVIIMQRLK